VISDFIRKEVQELDKWSDEQSTQIND
jgi:hypothetical protein